MSEIIKCNFEGKPVDAIEYRGRRCWIASQVASAIGYRHGGDAVKKIAGVWSEDFERGEDFDTLEGVEATKIVEIAGGDSPPANMIRHISILYESGVYTMCLLSKLPAGRRLRRWLSREVIPSIRKAGAYSLQQKVPTNFAEALELAARTERARLATAAQLEAAKPKCDFADGVKHAVNSVSISDFAKSLANGGIPFGELLLYKWLRQEGYLCPSGSHYNQPFQPFLDAGYFKRDPRMRWNSEKKGNEVYYVTLITGRGQTVLEKKIRENPETWKELLRAKLAKGKRARRENSSRLPGLED